MDSLEGIEICEISHKEKDKPLTWNLKTKSMSITETDSQMQRTNSDLVPLLRQRKGVGARRKRAGDYYT